MSLRCVLGLPIEIWMKHINILSHPRLIRRMAMTCRRLTRGKYRAHLLFESVSICAVRLGPFEYHSSPRKLTSEVSGILRVLHGMRHIRTIKTTWELQTVIMPTVSRGGSMLSHVIIESKHPTMDPFYNWNYGATQFSWLSKKTLTSLTIRDVTYSEWDWMSGEAIFYTLRHLTIRLSGYSLGYRYDFHENGRDDHIGWINSCSYPCLETLTIRICECPFDIRAMTRGILNNPNTPPKLRALNILVNRKHGCRSPTSDSLCHIVDLIRSCMWKPLPAGVLFKIDVY